MYLIVVSFSISLLFCGLLWTCLRLSSRCQHVSLLSLWMQLSSQWWSRVNKADWMKTNTNINNNDFQTMFELSGSIYENLIISFIDGLTSVYLLKNKHQPKRFVFIIGEESMKRSSKICWLLVLLQMICCSEEVPVYLCVLSGGLLLFENKIWLFNLEIILSWLKSFEQTQEHFI